ncbi:MAG: hypothetical protein M1836_003798 [Candelina mexicana]|nr:MAG: hypothetical protein M1836_003798 [Candelina mexicana]
MDPSGINVLGRVVETPLQNPLALALAITKSKPANMSLTEYMRGLRQHVKAGRRENVASLRDRHVDGAAFWRTSYDKAEIAQAELRARIHELERRNETMASKLKLSPEAAVANLVTQGKRKREKEQSAETALAKPAKKAKTQRDAEKSLLDFSTSQFELSNPLNGAGSYMLLSYQLHCLLPRREFDASELSSTLVHLASAVSDVARSTCEKYRDQVSLAISNNSLPARSLQAGGASLTLNLTLEAFSTFRALERTFHSLLKGLDKLTKDLVGTRSQGILVYNFVKLLTNVFGMVSTVSLFLAEQQMVVEKISTLKGSKRSKTRTQNPRIPVSEFPSTEEDIRPHISRLLLAMVLELRPTQAAHCEILEGFLYVLLDRIGSILYGFVFKKPEDEDVSSNIRDLSSHGIGERHANEAEQRANRAEAYYLIWILERALASVQRDTSGRCGQAWDPSKGLRDGIGRSKNASMGPTTKELLSERARARLQNTLLRGMFGDDEKDFQDCLQKPPISEIALEMPTHVGHHDDAEDWFKGQVWRLLGWEILSKNVDLGGLSPRDNHIEGLGAHKLSSGVAVRT